MGTGNSGKYKNTAGSLKPEHLMDELRRSGVKFREEDVVMVTKTKKNELVWLEKGNDSAGLKHIEKRHSDDLLRKFSVDKKDIPNFVKEVFSNGIELHSEYKERNKGFEKIYLYKDEYFVVSGVGTNGFIVSIYPRSS